MSENLNIVLILNNIRSSENVGSIFRTADAFGVQKIYLCGYTPAPLDRFNRKNTKLAKASLGAEEFVGWEKCENLEEGVTKLVNFSSDHAPECTDIFLLKNSSCSLQSSSQGIPEHAHSKNLKTPNNFLLIGVEQNENSIDYRELKNSVLSNSKSNIALIFGNEVDGLSKEDLELCDIVAEIPMLGKKESLNVSVSVGVVLSSLV